MKRTTVFAILTFLYIALIAVLCFANFKSTPDVPKSIFGIDSDKVVHFIMFLPFPILAFFSFRTDRMGIGATLGLVVLIFAFGCLLAGTTEYVQGLLPYRQQDVHDFGADMLALIISSTVVFLISLACHVRKKA